MDKLMRIKALPFRVQSRWIFLFVIFVGALIFFEFASNHILLYNCDWPVLKSKQPDKENGIKALILADTHILGPRRSYRIDKWYREWHMEQAFKTALKLFRPDVVFILGDLFDEGSTMDDAQFLEAVNRFRQIFQATANLLVITALGNHDIGYYYEMLPNLTDRFESHFNNAGLRMHSMKGVHFVVINSIAVGNDSCNGTKFEKELQNISTSLKSHSTYSRPIVFQHYPTYRPSDDTCLWKDQPFNSLANQNYTEILDVLSSKCTDMIGKILQPRAAFAGHTHYNCLSNNSWNVEEYTVAAFNGRNTETPTIFLATFTQTDHAVSKCKLRGSEHFFQVLLATYAIVILCLSAADQLDQLQRHFTKTRHWFLYVLFIITLASFISICFVDESPKSVTFF